MVEIILITINIAEFRIKNTDASNTDSSSILNWNQINPRKKILTKSKFDISYSIHRYVFLDW